MASGSERSTPGERSRVVTPHDVVDSTRLPVAVTVTAVAGAGAQLVAAAGGRVQLAVVVGLLGVLACQGWPVLLDLPSPRSAAVLLAVAAAAEAITVGATSGSPVLRWLPATLAVGMLVAFLHQLLRRDGHHRLTSGVAGSVAGLALVACGLPIVALADRPLGSGFVAAAMAALAAGALVETLGRHPRIGARVVLLVLAAGAVTAVVVGLVTGDVAPLTAVGLGMLVASLSHSLRRVLAAVPIVVDDRRVQVAVGAASILVVGVVVFAMGSVAKV